MSFCFLYNVVSKNHSVQNSPWGGGGGSIASSRSICQPEVSVPLTYNGRYCGSCVSLSSARNFLMKLNK